MTGNPEYEASEGDSAAPAIDEVGEEPMPVAPPPASQPKKADNSELRKQYQDAIDLGEEAKKGNQISAGIWGAATLVCGFNCFQYLVSLSAAQAALQAAISSAAADVAALNTCAGLGNAIGSELSATLASCTASLGSESAIKAIAFPGFGAAFVAALPAGMSLGAAAEHSHKACQVGLNASLTSAVASANSQGAAWAATVYGNAGLSEACFAAGSKAAQSILTLKGPETAYWTLSTQIVTTGYFCSAAGVGAAAADLAISSNMAKNIEEGYAGAAVGAAAIIGTTITLATSSNAFVSHNASGLTSCAMTGLGTALTVQKLVTANDYDQSIQENTASRDALASAAPALFKRSSWMSLFSRAGDALSSVFGSCAYAAVSLEKDPAAAVRLAAACKRSEMPHPERVSCARSVDKGIDRILSLDPNRFTGLLGEFERIWGPGALKQVLDKPYDPSFMAALITKEMPEAAPQFARFFESVPTMMGKKLALGNSQTLAGSKPASLGVAATFNGQTASDTQLSDRAPAAAGETGAPSVQLSQPELSAATSSSLFDIVSKRYDKVRDRVEKSAYVLPFNKFQTSK